MIALIPPVSEAPEADRAPKDAKVNGSGTTLELRANRQIRDARGLPQLALPLPPLAAADRGLGAERNLLEIARSALIRKPGELAIEALGRHAGADVDESP